MFELLNTPWKIANGLRRMALTPLIRLKFQLAGVSWGYGWRIYGCPIIQRHRESTLLIGDHLQLRSFRRSNPLNPSTPVTLSTRKSGAKIAIGDNFSMTGGAIIADDCIEIGNFVTVGANTVISDTDFHPLRPYNGLQDPNAGASAPIAIQDHVFIGMRCLILKGVTIGSDSVVGAGSVVTRNVPPSVIVAGNPARVLRELI